MSTAETAKIVLASDNVGKLREFHALLDDVPVEVVAQGTLGISSAEETGRTFIDNALLKARHAAAESGFPAIADDSGIAVNALDGRPGVFSARYAGPAATDEDNVDKLLAELDGVTDRSAYFHCALVYVRSGDDPDPIIAEASWHGEIAAARRGSGGFGYDPVFYLPELDCHSAELPAAEKNRRSHRGQALKKLITNLRTVYSG